MHNFFVSILSITISISPLILLYLFLQHYYELKFQAEIFLIIIEGIVLLFANPILFLLPYLQDKVLSVINYPRLVMGQDIILPDVAVDIFINNKDTLFYVIFLVWIFGMFTYIFWQFLLFLKVKSILKMNVAITNTQFLDILDRIKTDMNIKQEIRMEENKHIFSPMISQLAQVSIIFPANILMTLSESEISLIIRHELIHFQRKDFIIKLAMTIINGIYWFNPLIYILKSRLYFWLEYACDEHLLKYNIHSSHEYAKTILKILDTNYNDFFITNAFGSKKQNLKRRLYRIMKTPKNSHKLRIEILLLTGLIMLICPFTVYAAEHKMTDLLLENQVILYDTTAEGEDFVFEEIHTTDVTDVFNAQTDMNIGDSTFIDSVRNNEVNPFIFSFDSHELTYSFTADGVEHPITQGDIPTEYNFWPCSHKNIVDGIFAKHYTYADGSCRVCSYAALHCPDCDNYWIKEDLSEIKYYKCPH